MVSEPANLQTFLFDKLHCASLLEILKPGQIETWVLPKIAPRLEDRVNDLIGLLSSQMPR